MKLDITLRALAGLRPPALIRAIAGAGVADSLPTEFPDARDRRVDTLLRLDDGRILHLEWQTAFDAAMPRRMLWYWLLISDAHPGEPIEQAVIQVGGSPGIPDRLDAPGLAYRFRVLDTRGMDPEPLLASPATADIVLAILFGREHLDDTVRRILMRLAVLGEPERRDALTRLVILGGLRGATELIRQEVRRMPLVLDTDRDPFLAELVRSSMARGEARGIGKGEAMALVRVAERKFGPLSASARERILNAPPATVAAWLDRIVDAPDPETLFADSAG